MATFYCPDCGRLHDGTGSVGVQKFRDDLAVSTAVNSTYWNASIGGSSETYIHIYVMRVSKELTGSSYDRLPWAESAIKRRWPMPLSVVQEWNAIHPKNPVWTQYPDGSPYVPSFTSESTYPGAPWVPGFWPWVAQQFSPMMRMTRP